MTEQLDHAVYGDHTQLSGQQPLLAEHDSLSVSTSHVPPHNSAVTTLRVRVRVPSPHVTEQPDHADQELSWQLAAQHAPPHASVSDKLAGQAAPPQFATAATDRLRDREPPPHVCEHALHCDQEFN